MLRAFLVGSAAAALVGTVAATDATACVLKAKGHPTVDLTPLALTDQDYSVGSHLQDNFDYVVNVCSNLNWNDDVCVEGSSVCQRHRKTDLATDVFGYSSSISLGWEDPNGNYTSNSTVVMQMSGTACSATKNTTEAAATFVFVCSSKEFLMLESEDLDKCTATFVFFTAQACGTPRYSCFNGTKCVESDNYTGEHATFDECAANCGATKYACVEGDAGMQCVEKPDGPFDDEASCTLSCTKATE
jgi:hypothetical protein